MRRIALIEPSLAFSSQESGRARFQIDRRFAIARLPRKRRQQRKSCNRTQFGQVAGFPQRIIGEATGTRNRNERHLTTWTGLTRRSAHVQDRILEEPTMIEEAEKSVQHNALRTILTDAIRIAKYWDVDRGWPNSRRNSVVIPITSRRCFHAASAVLPRRGTREKGRNICRISATYLPLPKEPEKTDKVMVHRLLGRRKSVWQTIPRVFGS
jgi:hypothetical protein